VEQQYLPDELLGTTYYHPYDSGYEKEIGKRLAELKGKGENCRKRGGD
jgi:putative ATPase